MLIIMSNNNLLPGKTGGMTKNEETNFVYKLENDFKPEKTDLVHSIVN